MTAAAPRAVVITVSDRAAAGEYPDRSGPLLVELAAQAGCVVDGPRVVPDGLPVAEALPIMTKSTFRPRLIRDR